MYEIEEIENDRIVFVGNVNRTGKKPIEVSRIKRRLPRTNLELFSPEDFAKLKQIEKEIILNYKPKKKEENIIRVFFKKFLEI